MNRAAQTTSVIFVTLCCGCSQGPAASVAAFRDVPGWTYDQGGIIRGDKDERKLALVFTGGDHGEGTPAILDALQERNLKVSFFVTGGYLAQPQRRADISRMVAEGHYVGPHSHAHLLYAPWNNREQSLVTQDEFATDLERNIADLRKLGALQGDGPIFFIPPYEWYNRQHVEWAASLNIVLFNFTPGIGSHRDWIPEDHPGFKPSAEILQDVLDYERGNDHGLGGAIMLLHLGSLRRDKTHNHLPDWLDALIDRDYEIVRIDKLLRPARTEPRP